MNGQAREVQIPPPQPKKGYKKDIATKSLDFQGFFVFLPFFE
jgi:hypothetical protein